MTVASPNLTSAINLARSGQLNDACSVLADLAAKVPSDPEVAFWYGYVLLELGVAAKAVEPLSVAAGHAIDSPLQPHLYGLTLTRIGRFEEAIAAFDRALMIDPGFTDALYNRAKALKDQGRIGAAAEAYIEYLARQPNDPDGLYNLANIRFEQNRPAEAVDLFKKLIDSHPLRLDAQTNLALALSQLGELDQAVQQLELVLAVEPTYEAAIRLLHSIQSRRIPGWHLGMLADTTRNQAYDDAIRKAARGAKHVLDIGTGSGLLAMMAARAGAAKITACEQIPTLAQIAEKIVRKNGFEDRIQIIGKKSMDLEVGEEFSERADLLIAEIFDVGLLGEQCLPTLLHARENLLTPDARIIPAAARIYAALIECKKLRHTRSIADIAGFDMSDFDVFRKLEYSQVDLRSLDHRLLSEPFVVGEYQFDSMSALGTQESRAVSVTETGTCDGVVFWFDLYLDEEISISTAPSAALSHWGQALQMLPHPETLHSGEDFDLICRQDAAGISFLRPG